MYADYFIAGRIYASFMGAQALRCLITEMLIKNIVPDGHIQSPQAIIRVVAKFQQAKETPTHR